MNMDLIREIALSLPAVTEDIKWEEHVCFNVGDKMILITSPDSVPVHATFKVPSEAFDELLDRDGFRKASHLGRYHWVQVDDIGKLSLKEWKFFIRQSYELVVAKLPARKRKELGI